MTAKRGRRRGVRVLSTAAAYATDGGQVCFVQRPTAATYATDGGQISGELPGELSGELSGAAASFGRRGCFVRLARLLHSASAVASFGRRLASSNAGAAILAHIFCFMFSGELSGELSGVISGDVSGEVDFCFIVSDDLSGELSGEVRHLLYFSETNRFLLLKQKRGIIFCF